MSDQSQDNINWFLDRTRPEAIEARRQSAKFHNSLNDARKRKSDEQRWREISENLSATPVRLIVWLLDRFAMMKQNLKKFATLVSKRDFDREP